MGKKVNTDEFIKTIVYGLKSDPSNVHYNTVLWLALYVGLTNEDEVIKYVKEWENAEGCDQ